MNYLMYDMLAIADEKHVQMCELLELTKEQTELLIKEDVENLERYIGYKQNIIDRVSLLDARYNELSSQLLAASNASSLENLKGYDVVDKVLDFNSKTRGVIRAILDMDNMNSRMGNQLLTKLGESLKHSVKAPMVFREYQKETSEAIFINRQG